MNVATAPRAPSTRAYTTGWVVGPVACAAVATVIGLVEDPEPRFLLVTAALPLFGTVAAATAVARVRRSQGRRRTAWRTLALALCLGVFANYLTLGSVLGVVPLSWHGAVDLLLVAALVVCVIGLTIFPPNRRRGTDLARLVMDGLVVGGSALFLASVTIFPGLLPGRSSSWADSLQVLALPVMDLVIVTLAILLIARSGLASRTPLLLVGSSFLLNSVSDMAYAVRLAEGAEPALGSPWDLFWLVGYAGLSLAALHPDAGEQPRGEAPEASALVSTVVCFSIFLAAAAVSLVAASRGEMHAPARVIWGLVIFAVVVRQVVLVLDNERLRRALEVRVADRTKELRAITRQQELLLTSVADGIYGVDRDGRITMVNDATTRLLARPEDELIGADAHELFHAPRADGTPYPREGCYITEATVSGLIASGEEDQYLRGDGSVLPVEATASPLTDEDGIRGAVVVFRDVSQRRDMDRMKRQFISFISHELRTPLTSIRGSLGLLAGGALGALPQRAARMVDIATAGTVRLGRLVNDILDIERLESGMLPLTTDDHDVSSICCEALKTTSGMAEVAGIDLVLGPVTGRVHADRDRVVQVLINLLGNGIRFSDRGGSVRLDASPRGDMIRFAVADRGVGIPASKLDSIFDRFSQANSNDAREKAGSGLGLAICRLLVDRMGGRIWAESVAGQGSTFRVDLPAARGGGTDDGGARRSDAVGTGGAARAADANAEARR